MTDLDAELEPALRKWAGVVGVELPEGVIVHPKLADMVRESLDNPTACDPYPPYEGFRLSIVVEANDQLSADQELSDLKASILEKLGLQHDSIREYVEAFEMSTYHQPND